MYKTILSIITIFIMSMQSANALNLKQKKLKAEAEKKVEGYLSEVDKSCGCRPKINIDWNSLEVKDDFWIPHNDVRNVSEAMGKLCKDFKKEICAGVKSVTTGKLNVEKLPDPVFSNGDIKLGRKVYNEGWGADTIKKLLEDNL